MTSHTHLHIDAVHHMSAIIRDSHGNVLVVTQDSKGFYWLPGGKLENEDPISGLKRELSEELHLEEESIEDIAYICAYETRNRGKKLIVHLYEVTLGIDCLCPNLNDIEDACFINPAHICDFRAPCHSITMDGSRVPSSQHIPVSDVLSCHFTGVPSLKKL